MRDLAKPGWDCSRFPSISATDANALCVPCISAVATRLTDCLIRRSLTGYRLEMKAADKATWQKT
jgi:hypothetical protein